MIFLLTPPHGGDQQHPAETAQRVQISTHAPAWGGDQGHAVGLAAGLIISTHAPAWGATAHAGRAADQG